MHLQISDIFMLLRSRVRDQRSVDGKKTFFGEFPDLLIYGISNIIQRSVDVSMAGRQKELSHRDGNTRV